MDAPFTDHLTPLRRLYLVDDNEDGTAEARDNDRPRREALRESVAQFSKGGGLRGVKTAERRGAGSVVASATLGFGPGLSQLPSKPTPGPPTAPPAPLPGANAATMRRGVGGPSPRVALASLVLEGECDNGLEHHVVGLRAVHTKNEQCARREAEQGAL